MKSLATRQPNALDSGTKYRSVMEFDVVTGRGGAPFTDDIATRFRSLACSADGNTIIAGADDGKVHIFDRKQPMAVRKLSGHVGPVHAVRLSEDGERLFSVGNANLILCRRLSDGRVEFGRRFRSGFTGIDISRDESAFLIRGGFDIRLFDRNEEENRKLTVLHGHTSYLRGLFFLADESRAVSGSRDGTVRFWKLPKRRFPSPE